MMLYVFLLNLGSSLCSFISAVAAGVLWADKRKRANNIFWRSRNVPPYFTVYRGSVVSVLDHIEDSLPLCTFSVTAAL